MANALLAQHYGTPLHFHALSAPPKLFGRLQLKDVNALMTSPTPMRMETVLPAIVLAGGIQSIKNV
jgi:hypothetical protein